MLGGRFGVVAVLLEMVRTLLHAMRSDMSTNTGCGRTDPACWHPLRLHEHMWRSAVGSRH